MDGGETPADPCSQHRGNLDTSDGAKLHPRKQLQRKETVFY